jgi:hypothetical protein
MSGAQTVALKRNHFPHHQLVITQALINRTAISLFAAGARASHEFLWTTALPFFGEHDLCRAA